MAQKRKRSVGDTALNGMQSLPSRRSSRGGKQNMDLGSAVEAVPTKSVTEEETQSPVDIPLLAVPRNKVSSSRRARNSNTTNAARVVETEDVPTTKPTTKPKKAATKSSISAKRGADEIKAYIAEQEARKQVKGVGDESQDPEADAEVAEDIEKVKLEARRPPPVNSDYLPLPWKGRLGYACLNTYLRTSTPPIFSSRTCRIASILAHRHPLTDLSAPEHPTKNRPDMKAPADVERGQQWLQQLGLANARDIIKMLRWNEKYGIKFLRLSSEMFPFASHPEYGYTLDFAADVLAEAGAVAGELGHRLSTHPGQFTQLGSPRPQVIQSALRDLKYHSQMLGLLRLPEQQNRDAVMVLHMGGVFGSKTDTLERFRGNYAKLPQDVKDRLVLENDDVSWSVHDLLPICEELNIPMVLDFHHHNIIFDESKVREGTADLMGPLMERIVATWKRKNKTPKMHYSEPTGPAITGRQRRKHSARVRTLPPCPSDMDLMIEAKDKEQAVFELMRAFRLPGWERANTIVPYERDDDERKSAAKVKKRRRLQEEEDSEEDDAFNKMLPAAELGMGGPHSRVYWPEGMEEWLVPKKREVKAKKKDDGDEVDGLEGN